MNRGNTMKKRLRSKIIKRFDYQKLGFMFKELEYGMDTATNTIFLNNDISIDSLYEVLARFAFLMKIQGTSRNNITLNVSSFGGDVYSMFGIHDYIRTLPIKVNTICIGPAMSASAFLLASGTGERIATKNSIIMFHQFNSNVEGKTSELMKNMGHIKKIQTITNELLGQYTKKNKSFWEKNTADEVFLTADDCLEYGVIDKIL
jgi:ATP-dependent Clp protease protease subunit